MLGAMLCGRMCPFVRPATTRGRRLPLRGPSLSRVALALLIVASGLPLLLPVTARAQAKDQPPQPMTAGATAAKHAPGAGGATAPASKGGSGGAGVGAGSAAGVMSERALLERVTRRRMLGNGLEVVVVENHSVPLATVEIDVRNGSFTQTPEYVGLAHMYEHMFFKANETYPEAEAFLERTAELGAVFNGTTKEESVSYYLTLPSDSLEGGVTFMAAALRTPLFKPEELAQEKEVVIGEFDRQEASPYFALTQAMGIKLWPDNWSRKDVIGDRDVIHHVTPDQMRQIQHRYYVPNNSVLIVTGDVDTARVFHLAEQMFGDWPKAANPFLLYPIPPITPLSGNEVVIAEAPVGAVTVIVQWQGPSVGADPGATYAADVFSDAVNMPGSVMQRRLVDSGLFEDIGVNYYTLNHIGPITISGQTTPDKLRSAMAALDREIARFDSIGYISAEDLAEVKAQRTVNSAFGRERASGYAHTIGFWWSVADMEYYFGYVDNMAAQTPKDLAAYAHRYIVGKPHVTGILISPADRRAIGLTEAELKGAIQ
jgi:zinc protease